ncbi:MAG: rhodanese family protein [Candidatus Sphingomonas colombiensis]|nr:rhodanese family protein [Sphingomonas sp.]WEK43882.1 MAG: rhodanese family protein [Sphingomonas sp.]
MMIETIPPAEARRLVEQGATLIDIRDADEYAREKIPGAVNVPLARIGEVPAEPLVFHCRSGIRTQANAAALAAAAAGAPCHLLAGGIDAWRTAGLPTKIDRAQPLELMRQVQLVAGGLILLGVVLGFLVAPALFGLSALSAFVGAGLMTAGATGWCGMARLLRVMPWNRVGHAA